MFAVRMFKGRLILLKKIFINNISVTAFKEIDMDGKSILCANHKHAVKFYCLKHDFPCCDRCIATQHEKCVDILSEEDLCNVKHSAEADEQNEAVCNLRKNIEPFKRSVSDILSILDEQKSDRLNEIQQMKFNSSKQG